tara:strand:- start:44926 stop:45726 length:801 start_codon:yes stop_codon:yes gene_type:complete
MSLLSGIANRIGSEAQNFGNRLVANTKQKIIDEVSDTGFGRALRTLNILPGANPSEATFAQGAWGANTEGDWRVRLSLPPLSYFADSILLKPLTETGHSMVFPYTPNVYITHTARYNSLTPTHSNYPFQIYEGSQVDQFTINGDFTVENSKEAEYWLAAIHYLKSVTKMAYGKSSNAGSPPPIVFLNGYGDYVFNNVPVLITSFNVTLSPDVDYIKADVGLSGSYAPAKSEISVTLVPQYSRDKINKFSLDTFVSGGYVLGGDGYL